MQAALTNKVKGEELRVAEPFADLPITDLEWIAGLGETLEITKGEKVIEEGDPADHMFIVIEGSFQFYVHVGGSHVPVTMVRKGAVAAALPYSRMKAHGGDVVALENARVLSIHRDRFPELLHRLPHLGERLVAIMSDRVREQTKNQQQREKMLALGKLSAGLAHELNNPTAATKRSASALRERFQRIPDLAIRVISHGLKFEELKAAEEVRQIIEDRPMERLSALERSEKEEEVIAWLDEHNVSDGYQLAGTFVEQGFTLDCLDEVAQEVPEPALGDVLAWMENYLAAHTLVDEILSATDRISELVTSIKSYTHMDRAIDRQPVNVCEGIDSTLVILGHKLRKKNIQVIRNYQQDLPPIQALAGELNQVWTNLIDNAIDAMKDGGVLTLSVEKEHDCLLVRVADNGTGIPLDLQPRIFEPFFTTKGVGEGTGLGLDIVHRIVTNQHKGTIKVSSVPGNTVFSVWLPYE
jgi:signal transduction histidine kinase